MRKALKTKSKFLSLVLRHKPEAANVTLDKSGWCDVQALLAGAESAGVRLSRDELAEIVETNEKKRFRLSDDLTRIRANQGHSLDVELELKEAEPPPELFHGTTERNEASIRESGLSRMKRHHVHLSSDIATARQVGMRHGKVLILKIDSKRMREDGYKFYLSENDVWLVDDVPPRYLKKEEIATP